MNENLIENNKFVLVENHNLTSPSIINQVNINFYHITQYEGIAQKILQRKKDIEPMKDLKTIDIFRRKTMNQDQEFIFNLRMKKKGIEDRMKKKVNRSNKMRQYLSQKKLIQAEQIEKKQASTLTRHRRCVTENISFDRKKNTLRLQSNSSTIINPEDPPLLKKTSKINQLMHEQYYNNSIMIKKRSKKKTILTDLCKNRSLYENLKLTRLDIIPQYIKFDIEKAKKQRKFLIKKVDRHLFHSTSIINPLNLEK